MKSNHHRILVQLGSKIRLERIKQGISQRLMASNLDIDERHLRRIEKGRTNPTITLLLDIAIYLDVSLDELLLPFGMD